MQQKRLLKLLFCVFISLGFLKGIAQPPYTETFESYSPPTAPTASSLNSFTNNSQQFDLSQVGISGATNFSISTYGSTSGYGPSANYIDNHMTTGIGNTYSIKTHGGELISIKSLYLFVSTNAGGTVGGTGTITINFLKGGTSLQSFALSNSFFLTNSNSPNQGFTLVDMKTAGGTDYSILPVDEIRFTTTSGYNYIAIDNFTYAPTTYWTGATNTAFATTSNWTNNTIPSSTREAYIPSSSNNPIISSSQSCFNLTVLSSTTLTNTNTLNIYGSISNNGTITSTGGTIGMTGSSAQTIPASTFSSNTIQNLTINNSSGVTLNGTLKASGIVALTSGTLTTGGYLTIAPGGAITGTYSNLSGSVTLQQSIIAQRGWRMFANPFTTTQTFSSLASTNNISIQTTGSSNAAGIADVRTFSNSTNTWSDAGTSTVANTAYSLFIRGLATEVTGLTYTNGPTAFTFSANGTLNGNSYSVPAQSSTANFMLIGNPYAAPVNSSALTNGTGKSYYVYQISQGAGQTAQRTMAGGWSAVLSSSATTPIPILSVVAYKPSVLTSYSISTSDINTTNAAATGLFGTETPVSNIELIVEKTGVYQDRLYVRMDAAATTNGTDEKDLDKFYNDNVNIYTITRDSKRLAIDARNVLNTISLGMYATVGDYNFKLTNNSLPIGTEVYLNDKFLNTNTALKVGDTYNFSITSDATSFGEKRFELQFRFSSKNTATAIDNNANELQATVLGNITSNNQIAVNIAGAKNNAATINVINTSGQKLKTINLTNGIQYINIGQSVSEMLLLQITDGQNTITKKIMKL